MVHEFANNGQVTVNNRTVFKNDLSGSRAEFGAGVAVKVSKNLQLHADFEHSQGKNIEQPWGANVGGVTTFKAEG
jgi:outer membrane autotransporter protein